MKITRRNIIKGALATGTSILLTGRPDYATAREVDAQKQNTESINWNKNIPISYKADVAVIGGGIAGVCAACAAAMSGASVILIERFAVTGGILTTGGVASFCGETAGQGEVFDEIIKAMTEWNAIEAYKPYIKAENRKFNNEILAIVLQELLLKRNVKLLLHTRFADVVQKDGIISHCIVAGKSGLEAVAAKQFIDCSGDGDVARFAGFSISKGRESDKRQLPMSMMYFVRQVDPKSAFVQLPDGWFEPVKKAEDLPMTSIWPNGPKSNAVKIKIPKFDSTSTQSLTAAEIKARRRMMEVLYYQQAVEKRPWILDHCASMIGIREGCRIVGNYTLSVDDLRAGKKFEDAIACGTFYLDGHNPDDDKRTYILPKDQLKVPPYQIPMRSIIAKDGRNLWMAGRCFSADQLALSSARVATTAAMLGQAAGIAAALCVKKKCEPRKLDCTAVRKIICDRGGKLDV